MGISEKLNCQCTAFESFARSHIFDSSDFLLDGVPAWGSNAANSWTKSKEESLILMPYSLCKWLSHWKKTWNYFNMEEKQLTVSNFFTCMFGIISAVILNEFSAPHFASYLICQWNLISMLVTSQSCMKLSWRQVLLLAEPT